MKKIFVYIIFYYNALSSYNCINPIMYRQDIKICDLYVKSICFKEIFLFKNYFPHLFTKHFFNNIKIIKQASFFYVQNFIKNLQKKLFSIFHENKTVYSVKKIILCFYAAKYHLIVSVFKCTFSWCMLQVLCIGTLHLFHILKYITFFNNIENLSNIYLPYTLKLIKPYHLESIWLQKSFVINNLTACNIGMIFVYMGNIMWIIYIYSTCKKLLSKLFNSYGNQGSSSSSSS